MVDQTVIDAAAKFHLGTRQRAAGRVVNAYEDDPDEAARALDLGKATGIDPNILYGDMEDSERRVKNHAVSAIINDNKWISKWLDENPMAARVAHDDIGVIDRISQKAAKAFSSPIEAAKTVAGFHPIVGGVRALGEAQRMFSGGGPGPVERGFVSTFLEQNPELAAEFLEGVSYQTDGGLKRELLRGSATMREWAKLSPEDYKMQVKFWDIRGPAQAIAWAGEALGQAAGSSAIPGALGAAGAAVGIPGGPIGMGVGGVVGAGSAGYVFAYGEVYKALKDAGVPAELAAGYAHRAAPIIAGLDVASLGGIVTRFGFAAAKKEVTRGLVTRIAKELAISGATEASTEAMQEMVKDAAVSIASGKEFLTTETAKGWVESAAAGFVGGVGLGGPAAVKAARAKPVEKPGPGPAQKAEPYLDAGVEPPPGLDLLIDQTKADQAKMDLKNLEDLKGEMGRSLLNARSPDMSEESLREQLANAKILVAAHIVAQLYGDKPIHPEDGLLGMVPDLKAQLAAAEASPGNFVGDVAIPANTWLAKVDKELAKQLKDHIKIRSSGITAEEGEQVADTHAMIDAWQGPEAYAKVERQAGAVTGLGAPERMGIEPQPATSPETNIVVGKAANAVTSVRSGSFTHQFDYGDKPGWVFTPPTGPALIEVESFSELIRPVASTPIKDVLSQVDLTQATEFGLELQPVLDRIMAIAGDVEIHVIPTEDFKRITTKIGKNWGAFYSHYRDRSKPDHIVIPSDMFYLKPRQLAYAVLHEAIHAATHMAILNDAVLAAKITAFMKAVEAQLPEAKEQYGWTNADEFLAEAISNKIFQAHLANVLMTKEQAEALGMKEWQGKTLWQGILQFIWEAMGLAKEDYTALQGAFRLTEEAMDVQEMFQRARPTERLQLAAGKGRTAAPTMTDAMGAPALPTGGPDELTPPAPGFVRFYHGGQDPTSGGGRWVSQNYVYARDYREGQPVFYVDIPETSPLLKKSFEDEGVTPKAGYVNFEVPAELAKDFKPVPPETAAPGAAKPEQKIARRPVTPIQLELPEITRQEDRPIFKRPRDVGLTKEQYALWEAAEAKKDQATQDHLRLVAQKAERLHQTEEWKNNALRVQGEVEQDLADRQDLAVSEFFRTGRLFGIQSTTNRPRLNPDTLTSEQRKLFPERWVRRGSKLDALEVAQTFGYHDVDAMVDHQAELEIQMLKGGWKRWREYYQNLVKTETARRMQAQYGELEKNILREAEEHVIGSEQIDFLHEDTVRMGMENGWVMPFTKEEIQEGIEKKFGQMTASEVNLTRMLIEAGKHGKLSGLALLEDNPAEFFKQRQAQEYKLRLAAHAAKFQKQALALQRTVKRMSKRTIKGMDKEAMDFTQYVLHMSGLPGARSLDEIQGGMARSPHKNLRGWRDHAVDQLGYELFISENLLAEQFKDISEMTVAEFYDFKDSIDDMVRVGRKMQTFTVKGEKWALDQLISQLVARLETMPMRKTKSNLLYQIDAYLVHMERVFEDVDLHEELGPLFRFIVEPFVVAKHTEMNYMEELTKKLKALRLDKPGWDKTLKDKIPNDFLIDYKTGKPFPITREKMINIMLNFGNRGNIDKFVNGYARAANLTPQELEGRLRSWFEKHANLDDMRYVQGIWDIFEGWRKPADDLYYDLGGRPKWVAAVPFTFTDRHGNTETFRGGYFPIIQDEFRSDGVHETPPSAGKPFGINYQRATPANHYTEPRTGYISAVLFDDTADQVGFRMQQTIHDISYRRELIEAGKIIYNDRFRSAFRDHYGMEYSNKLDKWMKDIASTYTIDERAYREANNVFRHARGNLVIFALTWHALVAITPSMSMFNIAGMVRYERGFKENRKMILDISRELPHTFKNMDRDYRDMLDLHLRQGKFSGFKQAAIRWGFEVILFADKFFREVTFFNNYNDAKARGLEEGDAIAVADARVRERHGSGAVQDLPLVMRGPEFTKMFVMFYGWFSMQWNQMRQTPGMIKRGEYMEATKYVMLLGLLPILIGGAFSPPKKDEPLPFWLLRITTMGAAGWIPGLRDLAQYQFEGHTPRNPAIAVLTALGDVLADVGKTFKGKEPKKWIRHVVTAAGMIKGLPIRPAAIYGQGVYDINVGHQPAPRDFVEWWRFIQSGQTLPKK